LNNENASLEENNNDDEFCFKKFDKNGNYHCTDGPAVMEMGTLMFDGRGNLLGESKEPTLEWWVKGKLHRLDGPAVVESDGTVEWWMNSEQIFDGELYRKAVYAHFLKQLESLDEKTVLKIDSIPFSEIKSLTYGLNGWKI
jgi:hypothetical protein